MYGRFGRNQSRKSWFSESVFERVVQILLANWKLVYFVNNVARISIKVQFSTAKRANNIRIFKVLHDHITRFVGPKRGRQRAKLSDDALATSSLH